MIGWIVTFVAAAWLLPKSWQKAGLLLTGLAFLGVRDPVSLCALLTLVGLSSVLLRHARGVAVPAMAVTVAVVLLTVRLNISTSEAGAAAAVLGLSFYGLRILHYTVERARGRVQPLQWHDYLLYVSFAPGLIAGPIHSAEPFRRDGNRRRWDTGLFAVGLERILYGAVKILCLGNWICSNHLPGWIQRHSDGPLWLLDYARCVQYGANLYFQFAGYSDVAIGVAALVGYHLPENFNWPFLARNINDFWRRWHMSLSTWCREYVFLPVMAASRAPYAASICAMLVLGVWHEVTARYVVWGLYHGLGIGVWHAFQAAKIRFPRVKNPWIGRALTAASTGLTLQFVILGFALTKEDTLATSWTVLTNILTLRSH